LQSGQNSFKLLGLFLRKWDRNFAFRHINLLYQNAGIAT
jgi:hypothetical protein